MDAQMHTTEPQAAPASLASLEPFRNNRSHWDIPASAAQRRLFSKDWDIRARTIIALRTSDDPQLNRRAERIDGCCHTPQLRSDPHGKPSLLLSCCRDRLCPRCQGERGRKAAQKIAAHINTWSSCRFFTVTQAHRHEPLRESLDRLHANFRLLRRHPAWKQRVTQGVWSIEVTRNVDLGTWHVHVHILAAGGYFEQSLLSRLWHTITTDSKIVDVRAVHDREKTAKYIAAYVSKPFDAARWQPEEICEYAAALHGRRLVHTFGTSAIVNPDEAEPAPAVDKSELVCPLAWIANGADRAEPRAQHAMEILRRMGQTWALASGQEPRPKDLPSVPVEVWEHDFLFDVGREYAIKHWTAAQETPAVHSEGTASRSSHQPALPFEWHAP